MNPKRIDELPQATAQQVSDTTMLIMIGDPATGQLYKTTRDALLGSGDIIRNHKYTATGNEGNTLTVPEVQGYSILTIVREGNTMYEVGSNPDSVEFTWNGTTVTLGLPVQRAGERFLFIFK